MKKFAIPLLLLMVLLLSISCVPTGNQPSEGAGVQASTLATRIGAVEGKVDQYSARIKALEDRPSGGSSAADIEALNKKITDLKSTYAADIETLNKKIATLTEKDTALDASIKQWTTPMNTQPGAANNPYNPGYNPNLAQGQVYYQIINPQQWYSLSTGTIPINVRITNNKSDTRYTRPTISLTTFQNQTAGAWTSGTATVMSTSLGQTPIIYGSAGTIASPIGAVTNVMFIPTSGGAIATGEYMIAPGQYLDMWININIVTAVQTMWTVSVSGSDRPLY
jgi:hypothetical protein